MTLEKLFELWRGDAEIDRTMIGEELRKIPKLHAKYFELLSAERLRLLQLNNQLKTLKQEKYEFYTTGETAETREKGWKLPPRGTLLKNEAQPYIDSDKDVIDLTLKIGVQNEKVELLKSVLDQLKSRSWDLRGQIEWEKFRNGA